MKKFKLIGREANVTYADTEVIKKRLKNFELLEFLNTKELNILIGEDHFELEITLLNKTYHLELFAHDLRTSDYRCAVNGELLKENSPNSTFKGSLKGTGNRVRLSITEHGITGFIEMDDHKLFIHPSTKFDLKEPKSLFFVVYSDNDVLSADDFFCGVSTEFEKRFLEALPKTTTVRQSSSPCLILKIATDADYAFYLNNFSSVIIANNEILSMINQIEDVYLDTFDLAIRVTFQHVWSTNDPYVGDPSIEDDVAEYLDSVENYWEGNFTFVVRDLVHLVSGRLITEVSGAAYVGVVCSNPSKAYGYTLERFRDYLTMAHEIGHNFDGRHEDGINCGLPSASLMCQRTKQYDPMYFSPASITRISNYINANNACLDPLLAYKISGNSLVCVSETYTVSHLLPSTTSVWSVTPSHAATISGTGNSRTVNRNPSYNGPFLLNIVITANCGSINLSKSLYAGAPNNISVDGFTFVPRNQSQIYMAQNVPVQAGITNYGWFVIPDPGTGAGGGGITPLSPGVAEIWFENAGSYDVGVNVTNPCGWVESEKLTVEVY